jgi:hypothetical protein
VSGAPIKQGFLQLLAFPGNVGVTKVSPCFALLHLGECRMFEPANPIQKLNVSRRTTVAGIVASLSFAGAKAAAHEDGQLLELGRKLEIAAGEGTRLLRRS